MEVIDTGRQNLEGQTHTRSNNLDSAVMSPAWMLWACVCAIRLSLIKWCIDGWDTLTQTNQHTFSSGKSYQMSTALILQEPIMETLTFNLNVSMSTTMRLQVPKYPSISTWFNLEITWLLGRWITWPILNCYTFVIFWITFRRTLSSTLCAHWSGTRDYGLGSFWTIWSNIQTGQLRIW